MSFGEIANPMTSDGIYSDDESEFLAAADRYKSAYGVKFLTLCDHVKILQSLGWERTNANPSPLFPTRRRIKKAHQAPSQSEHEMLVATV